MLPSLLLWYYTPSFSKFIEREEAVSFPMAGGTGRYEYKPRLSVSFSAIPEV